MINNKWLNTLRCHYASACLNRTDINEMAVTLPVYKSSISICEFDFSYFIIMFFKC